MTQKNGRIRYRKNACSNRRVLTSLRLINTEQVESIVVRTPETTNRVILFVEKCPNKTT